ncbi:hypothetical protein ACF0H5_000807 [Mactra antiquata]
MPDASGGAGVVVVVVVVVVVEVEVVEVVTGVSIFLPKVSILVVKSVLFTIPLTKLQYGSTVEGLYKNDEQLGDFEHAKAQCICK